MISNNVIQFSPKKKPLTPEQLIDLQLVAEEEYLDNTVEEFLIDAIENMAGVDVNMLLSNDEGVAKSIAFLRENMRAVIYRLQNKEHELHELADDIIEFTDNPNSIEITLD
jgi:hypothetical protein